MDRLCVCLLFLTQFLFVFELFHYCIPSLLGMVQYEVLTASGEFRAYLRVFVLQLYIPKELDSYFLYC